ncbi:Bacteriophage P22, Gp10, DNA-stabilising [uncultured Caudovirales phage]|uniref:Bacteriophage P22, Gp10, DNA-stabilising n=1 Tax=uncultured Caudovirales phage TaxID=2100421 RepID=A0A6J5RV16_9CAUD|nr:Bacteriophage P22, Gp10, DNA-stabilising [uncultured Caudovirales phage]
MISTPIDHSNHGEDMRADFPVVGPFDRQRTTSFNAEDTINWYVIQDRRGKKEEALAGTPGLQLEYQFAATSLPVRTMITFRNKLFAIAGNIVFRGQVQIGTIGTVSGFVDFSINNANQIFIVDGSFGYILDPVLETVTQITDPAFPAFPASCSFLEGFFIVANAQSIEFYISAPNNGLKWDFKDVAAVNTYGGNIVAVGVVNKRLFFFKETSTEVWYLSGDIDFPFRRDNNLIIPDGIISAGCVKEQDGTIFWISKDNAGVGSVLASDGVNVKRVSTDAIDILLRSFENIQDVQTYIYKDDGHMFYVASWTTADCTLVYDSTSDYWHRMEMLPKKFNPLNPLLSKIRHISSCHQFHNNQHYVGDFRTSKVYTMSLNYGDNAGEPIRRIRILRHFNSPTYNRIQIDSIQVDFQSGIGDGNVSVTDPDWLPQAYLSWSKDGGRSFGNERKAPLGRQGNYQQRTIWRLIGTHRDFVAKLAIYSDVKPIFMLGGAIDFEDLET